MRDRNHRKKKDRQWVRITDLAGDASTRCYQRLEDEHGASIVRAQYPTAVRCQLRRDLEVLRWCSDRGLGVPRIIDSDVEAGWVLLDDFGVDDAESILRRADPVTAQRLSGQLITPLEILCRLEPQDLPPWNPPLDHLRMRWELAGFELWFLCHGCGRPPTALTSAGLDELAEQVARHPTRVCHRDYHLNNLYFLSNSEIGVIDVQDILVGPDTYDAVSLIAERAMPEIFDADDQQSWLQAWAERTHAAPGWHDRVRAVRLQRGLKVLGTFSRLLACGRAEYGPWTTRLARRLSDDLGPGPAQRELKEALLHWVEVGGRNVR